MQPGRLGCQGEARPRGTTCSPVVAVSRIYTACTVCLREWWAAGGSVGAGRGSLALGDPPLPIREEKLEAGQATPPRRPGLHNPLTAHVSYCPTPEYPEPFMPAIP